MLDARAEALVASEVQARNDQISRIAASDVQAMGWPHPCESARLFVAMVAEIALMELAANRRLPDARQALNTYIDPAWRSS